jgi:2-(1,2-epoxy-1,2-dihydrophenyl)acetyl-CoA isomerase
MPERTILLEKGDGVATLTLNDPARLNALNVPTLAAFGAALDDCARDESVRVVVLTGSGRGFCAGADLSNLPAPKPGQNVIGEYFNPVVVKLIDLPKPTIAAVNGVAAGGGYSLALSCDLAIVAESAHFVLVFTPQLGIIPDMGASWHAPRGLGRARAMAMAFFGDRMSAAEAFDAGLIWKCVPDEQLMDEVAATAGRLKNGPTRAYPAVRKAFDLAHRQTLHEQLDMEAEDQLALLATEDFREGVRAFLKKEKPRFKGR